MKEDIRMCKWRVCYQIGEDVEGMRGLCNRRSKDRDAFMSYYLLYFECTY